MFHPTVFASSPGEARPDAQLAKAARATLDRDLRSAALVISQLELLVDMQRALQSLAADDAAKCAQRAARGQRAAGLTRLRVRAGRSWRRWRSTRDATMRAAAATRAACCPRSRTASTSTRCCTSRSTTSSTLWGCDWCVAVAAAPSPRALSSRAPAQASHLKGYEFGGVVEQFLAQSVLPRFRRFLEEALAPSARTPWDFGRKAAAALAVVNVASSADTPLPRELVRVLTPLLTQAADRARAALFEMARNPAYKPAGASGRDDALERVEKVVKQVAALRQARRVEQPMLDDAVAAFANALAAARAELQT